LIYNGTASRQGAQNLKIAITADNHLTTMAKHPQRFQALEDIYRQCGERQIQLLIIAGDLFDQSLVNYADFEALYQQSRPADLTTIILPGNHDHQLQQAAIAGEGLQVYADPALRPLSNNRQILFLPYRDQQTMGEGIAPFAENLANQRWILVSHGDWVAGQKTPDPHERGVYMPLTRPDLTRYQPELVFLGHIHLPQDDGTLFYPGSPCPLDISETGPRRFLILDTERGEVSSHLVHTPLVYFDESFLLIPGEDELARLKAEIQDRIQAWNLPAGWEERVEVRVRIFGSSTSSRNEIRTLVDSCFSPYAYYQDQPPTLEELIFSLDQDKAVVASHVERWVAALDWEEDQLKPSKAHILQEALKIIYQT
jgi:DNA repair exonuclease SbcCD nuclease subunit